MLSEQELLTLAADVINEAFVGVMTTVDETGLPHARWMGARAGPGRLRQLYTLTARNTRKIEQLRANKSVCWLYSSDEKGDVVTLIGEADIIDSPALMAGIWERLSEAATEYRMGPMTDDEHLELVTIETDVHTIEVISPRLGIYQPQVVHVPPAD